MAKRIGKSTIIFENQPVIISSGAVVGTKEGKGPYKEYFDYILEDSRFGEKTFEQAESKMQKMATAYAINKIGLKADDIDTLCAGDLLNQCIGTSFGLKDYNIPLLGVYGACSTMALSMIITSFMIESGAVNKGVAVTSSHFCSAERQYRFPLEYGSQRTPNSQWTVTGSGAALLSKDGEGPVISAATIGKIVDLGVKDQNNMGAAMAPAAADTILTFLKDTNTRPNDYDVIFTGDLGVVGSDLLYALTDKAGIDIRSRHKDFGKMIFDIENSDVHAGGSGCGCSASLMCSYVMEQFKKGNLKNILYCATGALLSPTSVMQGGAVPGICHLVNICK